MTDFQHFQKAPLFWLLAPGAKTRFLGATAPQKAPKWRENAKVGHTVEEDDLIILRALFFFFFLTKCSD